MRTANLTAVALLALIVLGILAAVVCGPPDPPQAAGAIVANLSHSFG